MRRVRQLCILPLLALLAIAAGCGYRTVGSAHVAPGIKVLSVPAFLNQTHTYHIETALTNAVIREFNTRTSYRVVPTEAGADAVLRGTVVSVEAAPVAYDSVTGRASAGLVTVTAKVTVTAHDGRVLYSNPNYIFRDEYQISNELASFFEEQGPALDRIARDFSRTLVSNIIEGF